MSVVGAISTPPDAWSAANLDFLHAKLKLEIKTRIPPLL